MEIAQLSMQSQAECIALTGVASRLKEIREMRGLSQDAFAAIGGVTRNTQYKYESGRPPDSDYLVALHESGFDIGYVLTGRRSSLLTVEQTRILNALDTLPPAAQAALLAFLQQLAGVAEPVGDVRPPSIHQEREDFRAQSPKSD